MGEKKRRLVTGRHDPKGPWFTRDARAEDDLREFEKLAAMEAGSRLFHDLPPESALWLLGELSYMVCAKWARLPEAARGRAVLHARSLEDEAERAAECWHALRTPLDPKGLN